MRIALLLALGLLPTGGWAQAPLPDDPRIQALIQEALEANPDLQRARATAQAEKERIPQAGALPDPSLSLGIQNDGFKKIQIGQMEGSYWQVMITQPLPWPGKRGLRTDIARIGAQAADEATQRTRLTLEADVRRAYLALLLSRSQLRLLEDQALLLQQAEATARIRYEVGQGAQADLLRAQLERTRLDQTRLRLQTEERTALAGLNRLRAKPAEAPVEDGAPMSALPDPGPIDPAAALPEALDHTPEVKTAHLGALQSDKAVALARLDRRPDFGVTAGIMPRGGLDPMWNAGISISLPLWSGRKQARAVVEQEARRRASGAEEASVRTMVTQRVQERATQMTSALGILKLYRGGLLVQSEASFRATLAQYEVGRAPFLSVLEALNGWVADQSGLLQAQAQAQAVAIAHREFTLAATPPVGATALAGSGMGGGSTPSGAATAARPAGSKADAGSDSSSMTSM
ncbi:TolC family protein [Mesoterricola sediminis]|uniref:TolC family protein n=1 Tax=Mesoterricola sediminis TaxID=2927980 RepID=A0AA48GRG9_9BACT|nr:TolC family protein [Mesoterricola sediminis]BDU77906.1 hypothetical protein METESE_28640 [Mesoterricola sediminis]